MTLKQARQKGTGSFGTSGYRMSSPGETGSLGRAFSSPRLLWPGSSGTGGMNTLKSVIPCIPSASRTPPASRLGLTRSTPSNCGETRTRSREGTSPSPRGSRVSVTANISRRGAHPSRSRHICFARSQSPPKQKLPPGVRQNIA